MSVSQILPIKRECTFRFSSFLMIVLSDSSANFRFDITSILTALPEADLDMVSDRASKAGLLRKIYKPMKQDHFDIHQMLYHEIRY